MSIMPPGGWNEPPKTLGQSESDLDHSPQTLQAPPVSYSQSKSSYLTCKICDRGTLESKKVFRLSGPAVAIGYLLLIPSILGMIISGLLFIGVISSGSTQSTKSAMDIAQPSQSAFDKSFRRSCAKSYRQRAEAFGSIVTPQIEEQFCECALSTLRETGSQVTAAQTCNQLQRSNALDMPGSDIDALYHDTAARIEQPTPESNLLRVLGSVSALALGIACFVGGLLGWLLVMKKRVLQCDVCGAVVSAS
jgi:hypothetical protein